MDDRLKRHFNDVEKGDHLYFHRAILKYEKENFLIEEIDAAKAREELNTYKNGYNSTLGEEGGNTYAKKTEEELLRRMNVFI